MTNINVFIFSFILINLFSFGVMFFDKGRARLGKRRVSEKTLFLLALGFGGIGVYLGMFWSRHKTKKWYFVFGIPPLIALNLFLLVKLL